MTKSLQTRLFIFLFFSSCLSLNAQHSQFQPGDLFLAQGLGIIQWRDSSGTFIRNINTRDGSANGSGSGMRHHPITGELWITNFNLPPNSPLGVRIIHTDGTPGNAINISAYQRSPESIAFDKKGNAFVGGPNGELVKINSAGTTILDHYALPCELTGNGPDWVEMDCNDSIIYYTSERPRIKRYNVVTHTQLPDLAFFPSLVGWFFAMRLLPDSTLLAVGGDNIVFRINRNGDSIKSYKTTNPCGLFSVAGSKDGKSIWVGGGAFNGPIYKIDIATGAVQNYFLADPINQGVNIHGIAVYGDALKNCYVSAGGGGNGGGGNGSGNANTCTSVISNPNDGAFTLQTVLSGTLTIKMFNAVGQGIFYKEVRNYLANDNIPFDMRPLAAGIYLVEIKNSDRACLKKVLIR